MTSFSFVSSSRLIHPHTSSSNQPLHSCIGGKMRIPISKFHRDLSASYSISCNFPDILEITHFGSRYNRLFVVKISRNSQENYTHLGSKGKPNSRRRKFSLRLKPRLRLLSIMLKRMSIRDTLDDIMILLSRNSKRVTLSTVVSFTMGLVFLFLKFTAVPASKVVPYSDLIANLQSGHVPTVLFEEGSRRIFYNTEGLKKMGDDGTMEIEVPSEKTSKSSVMAFSFSRKTDKATPKWQFAIRKIIIIMLRIRRLLVMMRFSFIF